MRYTEFCCRSGGSQLNGGAIATNLEPSTGALYTCVNSNWNGTSLFTPADGSTPLDTVSTGDFASVYLDGATTGVYVARVTSIAAGANGAITLSATAKFGTAPTSNATGRSIKVGGAFAGPGVGDYWPGNFLASGCTNAAGYKPRLNLKNDKTYLSNGMSPNSSALTFQGYSGVFGDGGRAVMTHIDTVVGQTIYIFSSTFTSTAIADIIFISGLNAIFNPTAVGLSLNRVTAVDMMGAGFVLSSANGAYVEIEAIRCNRGDTEGGAITSSSANCSFIRPKVYGTTGTLNGNGMNLTGGAPHIENGLFYNNAKYGILLVTTTNSSGPRISNCDFFNNTSGGIYFTNASAVSNIAFIENCNFVKSSGYGLYIANISAAVGGMVGMVNSCGFGSGTYGNFSGAAYLLGLGVSDIPEQNHVIYPIDTSPYRNAEGGDFTIVSPYAIGRGRATYSNYEPASGIATGCQTIGAEAPPYTTISRGRIVN